MLGKVDINFIVLYYNIIVQVYKCIVFFYKFGIR